MFHPEEIGQSGQGKMTHMFGEIPVFIYNEHGQKFAVNIQKL